MASVAADAVDAGGRERVLVILLALIALVYLFQLIRPLHVEHDSVCYLRQAELGVEGRGYACHGCDRGGETCPILYPPGYPMAVGALMRIGAADARGFTLANLAFLAIAAGASVALWRRHFGLSRADAMALAALLLLSWPVFRYATTPMSDLLFAALAALTLWVASEAQRASDAIWRYGALAAGLALAWMATEVRTVGVALFPAVLWAAVWRGGAKERLKRQLGAHRARSLYVLAAAVVVLAAAASRNQYVVRDVIGPYREGGVRLAAATAGYRLTDFGELALNTSSGKLPALVLPLFLLAGAACIVALFVVMWRRRETLGAPEAFVLATLAIMVVYPWHAVRYWIPAMPVLLGLGAWSWRHESARRRGRLVLGAALAVYVAGGVAALAYTTRVSLRGRSYFTGLTDRRLGPAYRAAWGTPAPGDSADTLVVRILRRFGDERTSVSRTR